MWPVVVIAIYPFANFSLGSGYGTEVMKPSALLHIQPAIPTGQALVNPARGHISSNKRACPFFLPVTLLHDFLA